MKSIEDILSENEYDVHYYGGGRRHILSAMEEYAQQEAIAFAEWVDRKALRSGTNEWISGNGIALKFTTEELFVKFQAESKNLNT